MTLDIAYFRHLDEIQMFDAADERIDYADETNLDICAISPTNLCNQIPNAVRDRQ